MENQTQEVFEVKQVSKIYGEDANVRVIALDGVDLKISKGEFAALVGPSGSGKSTLLNIMSGLDNAGSGEVFLAGQDIEKLSGSELSDYRRDHIGFIFQSYNLIPVLTVRENVEYVMLLQGLAETDRKRRVSEFLDSVGLKGMEDRYPSQLSGGQQQRVAVARAMVSHPDVILADEPTANLDSKTGEALIDMMLGLNEQFGTTFVFSTHDPIIMKKAKRLIRLRDGKIIEDIRK